MSQFDAEYKTYCQTYGTPDRIDLMLCDMNAILRGKWLPASEVGKLSKGQVRLPRSTYAPNIMGFDVEASGLGIVNGDPDANLTPIAGTLSPVPWAKGNVAQVLVEMLEPDASICTISPRKILADVLSRFAKHGLQPVIACELEFYILLKRDTKNAPPRPPQKTPEAQNYDMEVLSRAQNILQDIEDSAKTLGLPTDTMIAEFGPGQFEINFRHTDDVLHAADTAVLFRRLVRGVVENHDMEATFMAKPYAEYPGNGMHLHASVLDESGQNIFYAKTGVEQRLLHAVGGVLETMPDLQAIFAPHLNSYRRFQPNSFAPSAPDWALDHRGAAIRLPDVNTQAARLEHRISGADVNPYLAFAAILGGMLHGIEAKIEPPLPVDDENAKPAVPLTHDWKTALERFNISNIAKEIFGQEYRQIYCAVRDNEIEELTRVISPIEYETYLSRL